MSAVAIRNLIAKIGGAPGAADIFDVLGLSEGAGKRFFVHSGTGSNATSRGKTVTAPLATLAAALAKCTPNSGDTVYLLPGHAETLSADVDFSATGGKNSGSLAGVRVVGLGHGSLKPTFTFGGTAVKFDVDVANIWLKGIKFVSNINDLVTFLDLDAGNFTCEDCDFVTSSAKEAFCFVDIATTFDDFIFRRCRFFQPTDPEGTDDAAGTGCFYFVDSENILVEDCFFYGNFETSIFHNKTTAAKNVWVRNSYGTQLLSTGLIYTQVAAMEGGNLNSSWNHRTAADVTEATWTGTVSANFFFDRTSGVLADGAAGGQYAAAGTADNS